MAERELMIGLSVLVIGGLGARLGWLLARRVLPATAWEGFAARGEVRSYFGAALSALVRKRWLLYVPFVVLMLSHGIVWVSVRRHAWARQLASSKEYVSPRLALDHARAAARVVLHASRAQFAGYSGLLGASLPVGGAVVALALLGGMGRLRRVTDRENMPRLGVVRAAAVAALVSASVAIFVGVQGVPEGGSRATWLMAASLLTWLFGLFLLAVVQGCFLCYVRGLLRGSYTPLHDVWNGALHSLYPLVALLGVAWTVVLVVPEYTHAALGLWAPRSGGWPRVLRLVSMGLAMWRRLVPSALALMFCCAPFFVVVNGERAMAALGATLRFIGEHTLKWAVMVGACVVVVAVPNVVGDGIGLWVPMHSWERLGLGFVIESFRIVAVAAAAIALFGFFLRYGAKKDDEGERGSSDAESGVGSRADGGGV